jgi:hypothetical protein
VLCCLPCPLIEHLRAKTTSTKTPVLDQFSCRFETALFLRRTMFQHFCALLGQIAVALGVARFHIQALVPECARGCSNFSSRRLSGPGRRSDATALALPAASRSESNDSKSGSNDSRSGSNDSRRWPRPRWELLWLRGRAEAGGAQA